MAMVLGACAARDPYVSSGGTRQSGNWQIEQQADRITGVPTPYAMVVAPESSNSYAEKPAPAGLHLTCFDGKPLVRFAFDFKVGSETNSVLGYRFDDKPGHDNVNVRFLQLYKTVVIEDRAEVIRFASELAGSRTLVVRIRSINAGRTVAEFPVDGAGAAIEASFAGCSLTEPQPAEKKRGAKA
jgi:hypothetical protein